jgi:hypothetical protein
MEFLIQISTILIKSHFKKDEITKESFKKNPFHPFKQTEPYTFVYKYSFCKQGIFYASSLLALTIIIIRIIKLLFWECTEIWFLYIFLLFILVFTMIYTALLSVSLFKNKTLILNLLENNYKFFFNDMLVEKESLGFLLLTLSQKFAMKNVPMFSLILSGKNIETIEIISFTSDLKFVQKHAKMLADNLTINYTDESTSTSCYLRADWNKENGKDLWSFLRENKKIFVPSHDPYWLKPGLY